MSRLPLVPTLVVGVAVAVMIALGVWQLQRAGEKERLLSQYTHAASLPALDLDPLLEGGGRQVPQLAFRRVLVTCRARDVEPELRGGRSRDGRGGYVYLVPCRPGETGLAGRLRVNVGWTPMPQEDRRLSLNGIVAGTLGAVAEEGAIMLASAAAVAPLAPSAAPSIEQIPNNHLFYAFQWFFFAAVAIVIYLLALRRRLSGGR